MPKTIVFVSCVKTKAPEPRPARSLYTSPLFTFSSTYAESLSPHWYILSAKYGLVHPEQVIAPYEKTLNNMSAAERKAWTADVLESLRDIVAPGDELVFLAGVRYREGLIPTLLHWGCKVSIPMEGLSFGRQLSWLKAKVVEGAKKDSTKYISRGSDHPAGTSKHQGGTMSQADQIRNHVIKTYIEPARKAGHKTVKVCARDVHKDLKLKNNYPNVCNALDGDKFKDQARVIIHIRSGPKQSSSVIWKYEISK